MIYLMIIAAKLVFLRVYTKKVIQNLFLSHEEHQRPKEKMQIKGKSRHFYDIYRIAQTKYATKAITDKEL
jgi:hypothetical protein